MATTEISNKFIYGSERKGENTTQAIKSAIALGYRAIDTANCCAYMEPMVGIALEELYTTGYRRYDFWVQSKFTFMYPWFLKMIEYNYTESVPGYDHKLSLQEQIYQSLDRSLKHLHVDYLDSYILHGSFDHDSEELLDQDLEAWRTLEIIYDTGKARSIGVSNYNFIKLEMLFEVATIKPMIVQYPFRIGISPEDYPESEYRYEYFNKFYLDQSKILKFCNEHHIEYQGFEIKVSELRKAVVEQIAMSNNVTEKQVAFRFAYQSGVVPLTGTQNEEHMKQNAAIFNFSLSNHEMRMIGGSEQHFHDEL